MKTSTRHLNSYLIWIVILVIMIIGLSVFRNGAENYTKNAFLKDLENGEVASIVIQPNQETPTGYLEIQMKNGMEKRLYVTDIVEMEKEVREYGYDPLTEDVQRDSWLLTSLLPMIIVLVTEPRDSG